MSVEKPEAKRVTFPPFEKGMERGKNNIKHLRWVRHLYVSANLVITTVLVRGIIILIDRWGSWCLDRWSSLPSWRVTSVPQALAQTPLTQHPHAEHERVHGVRQSPGPASRSQVGTWLPSLSFLLTFYLLNRGANKWDANEFHVNVKCRTDLVTAKLFLASLLTTVKIATSKWPAKQMLKKTHHLYKSALKKNLQGWDWVWRGGCDVSWRGIGGWSLIGACAEGRGGKGTGNGCWMHLWIVTTATVIIRHDYALTRLHISLRLYQVSHSSYQAIWSCLSLNRLAS